MSKSNFHSDGVSRVDLSNRQNRILEAIVREYIETGQPVGSKRISEILDLGVSSATIRSEMADLYEKGFLEQPHTSAGREPSHIGIRRYIDTLMRTKAPSKKEKSEIESLFNVRNPDPEQLLIDAAEALSNYTGYVSVTSALVGENITIEHLEFVAAGTNTMVIILIASSGVVSNKVCRVDYIITNDILEFFSKFANDRFAGRSIDSVSQAYVNAISYSLGEYSRVFTSLILAVYDLCREMADGKYYVSGSTKLLSFGDELGNVAKNLLNMIENHDYLEALFGPRFDERKVIVGKENPVVELTEASVLVTRYYVDGELAGTVGLIGPMRLDYKKVIPHLDFFALTLGNLLEDTLNPGE